MCGLEMDDTDAERFRAAATTNPFASDVMNTAMPWCPNIASRICGSLPNTSTTSRAVRDEFVHDNNRTPQIVLPKEKWR